VLGNFIGTDVTGSAALGNSEGVFVSASNIVVGGTEPGAGNLISGNRSFGVWVSNTGSTSGIRVEGNLIGTDITGTVALGNDEGILVSFTTNTVIGGAAPGAGNLVSGNRHHGIIIAGNGTQVQGNLIGTDIRSTAPLGNANDGVFVNGASNNLIGGRASGTGNIIAFNGEAGVVVDHGTGNALRRNAVFAHDASLGIRLVNGGNNNQAAPVLTAATSGGGFTTVEGVLASAPNTTFTVEIFVNAACNPSGFGEGEQFLASLTVATGADGHAAFALTVAVVVEPGQFLTATATDPAGNTSQFSACAEVVVSTRPDLIAARPDTSVAEGLAPSLGSIEGRIRSLALSGQTGSVQAPGIGVVSTAALMARYVDRLFADRGAKPPTGRWGAAPHLSASMSQPFPNVMVGDLFWEREADSLRRKT
jgi:hypothetical protein